MLFSIVLRFSNTWFLLCLEQLDADWLSKIPFIWWGVPRFWSTYIHTHDRLDKLRSSLAEAQLKIKSSSIGIVVGIGIGQCKHTEKAVFTQKILGLFLFLLYKSQSPLH